MTHNKLTCLFGFHDYSNKETMDKHGHRIRLCKVCRRSGHYQLGNGGETLHDYDEEGNMIRAQYSAGYKVWYDYNKKGNLIHKRGCSGREIWYEYDEKGNCIYTKWNDGYESWKNNDGDWVTKKPKNWKYKS